MRRNIEELCLEHHKSSTADVVSVSIGGATCSHTTGRSLEGLIKQADQALYKSKQAGRNRVTVEDIRSHKTVLIVDDDQLTLEMISGLLPRSLQYYYRRMTAENAWTLPATFTQT